MNLEEVAKALLADPPVLGETLQPGDAVTIRVAGTQGPQGDEGPMGPDGPMGPPGPDGIAGPTGPRGVPGNDGTNGKDGATGKPGAKGERGPKGDKGERGPQGLTGQQGPPGQSLVGRGSRGIFGGGGGSTPAAVRVYDEIATPSPNDVLVTFSTAAPFADNTIEARVDGCSQSPLAAQNGTAGTFTLAFPPRSDETVTVSYSLR